jgi:hypothetical protein
MPGACHFQVLRQHLHSDGKAGPDANDAASRRSVRYFRHVVEIHELRHVAVFDAGPHVLMLMVIFSKFVKTTAAKPF